MTIVACITFDRGRLVKSTWERSVDGTHLILRKVDKDRALAIPLDDARIYNPLERAVRKQVNEALNAEHAEAVLYSALQSTEPVAYLGDLNASDAVLIPTNSDTTATPGPRNH